MTFRASVLTLYPDMFPGPLGSSLAGRAMAEGIWSLDATNIRDFAADKHRSVDDTPAGGGVGMVLRCDVLAAAIDSVADGRPMLAMSPRGAPLTQARVRDLRQGRALSFSAAASRASTSASSRPARSSPSALVITSCQAGSLAPWSCSMLAFASFPA
jgi:hypothetical protein